MRPYSGWHGNCRVVYQLEWSRSTGLATTRYATAFDRSCAFRIAHMHSTHDLDVYPTSLIRRTFSYYHVSPPHPTCFPSRLTLLLSTVSSTVAVFRHSTAPDPQRKDQLLVPYDEREEYYNHRGRAAYMLLQSMPDRWEKFTDLAKHIQINVLAAYNESEFWWPWIWVNDSVPFFVTDVSRCDEQPGARHHHPCSLRVPYLPWRGAHRFQWCASHSSRAQSRFPGICEPEHYQLSNAGLLEVTQGDRVPGVAKPQALQRDENMQQAAGQDVSNVHEAEPNGHDQDHGYPETSETHALQTNEHIQGNGDSEMHAYEAEPETVQVQQPDAAVTDDNPNTRKRHIDQRASSSEQTSRALIIRDTGKMAARQSPPPSGQGTDAWLAESMVESGLPPYMTNTFISSSPVERTSIHAHVQSHMLQLAWHGHQPDTSPLGPIDEMNRSLIQADVPPHVCKPDRHRQLPDMAATGRVDKKATEDTSVEIAPRIPAKKKRPRSIRTSNQWARLPFDNM
ncbi:hypothetical protein EK21DRAFT_94959 [Setomelanomma holmii]|uniref:Uncharacterized protein n=1 Tax=Setomelanomma holmii TaxID=210430 RepID=A0A9P4LFM7_9PLEO|nr:hypothetical protein EK21DRAFT_94959 [Setomelanomma holmii]